MSTIAASRLAVEAHGLVKVFGTNRAVDGIDLAIPEGGVYGFLGPNGAGKTTTIRVLATLLRPDAGTAKVFGYDVVRESHKVRQLLGLTGQYASVDESLTATENLVLFGRLLGLSRKAAHARATQLLEDFGLSEAANKTLKHFSGGMRRRLDLAVSLIATPPLIFLDEPTTGLDPRTRNQMWDTIRSLVAAGATVLLTTQYLDEADQLADRIAVIDQGVLVAEGTAEELKTSIGGSIMEVRLVNPTDTVQAAQALERTLGGGLLTHENGLITISLQDPGYAADALMALKQNGIDLRATSVAQPTLDEVFLTLTDRTTEEKSQHQKGNVA